MILKIFASVAIILESLFSLSGTKLISQKLPFQENLLATFQDFIQKPARKPDLVIETDALRALKNPKFKKSVVKTEVQTKDSNNNELSSTAQGELAQIDKKLNFFHQQFSLILSPTSSSGFSTSSSAYYSQPIIVPQESTASIETRSTDNSLSTSPPASSSTNQTSAAITQDTSSLAPTGVVKGSLIINEIMYDLEGSDTLNSKSQEWIELKNISSGLITLAGGNKEGSWRFFSGGSKHLLSETPTSGSMTIPAGGFAILAGDANTFLQKHSNFHGTVIDTGISSLNNTGDALSLIGPDGLKIDEIAYQKTWGGAGNGKTLERKPGSSGLDQTSWQESNDNGGNPGI